VDISVFGLGYVGMASALGLARLGHSVVGVDIDELKIDRITRGVSPVVEPDTETLMRRALATELLSVTTDGTAAVRRTDFSLICVGTPSRQDGSPDLDQILRVASEIGQALRAKPDYHGVAIRSTVLPGTTEAVADLIAGASGKRAGLDFGVASNPDFMREGTSLEDFEKPPFTVVGTADERLALMIAKIYAGIEAPFHWIHPRDAEMLKYACNAFHAIKVTFANEIGALCKSLAIDSRVVMDLAVADTKLNVSAAYLKPGLAFGGSCLPKDLRAITGEARRLQVATPLLEAGLASNDAQIEGVVARVLATGRHAVGLIGLSFKSGTDDLRESPLVRILRMLLDRGCDVAVYDPNVSAPRLIGANRSYVEQTVPDLERRLRASAKEVLDEAEVVLVGREVPGLAAALERRRPGQIIHDLIGIAPSTDCDGLYW
jgi:GDP-mannose 6-dehydrogenase